MAYQDLLHAKALKAFRALPPPQREKVRKALQRLAEDPFTARPGADLKKPKGTRGREDLYRLRAGDLRAVYAVQGREVLVTDLFRRGEGYDV